MDHSSPSDSNKQLFASIIIWSIGIILVSILVWYQYFFKIPTAGVVSSHNWTRTVNIEACVPVMHESSTLPPKAIGDTLYEEHVGNMMLPVGSGEQTTYIFIPRYETWHKYYLKEWSFVRSVVANGNNTHLYWPEYTLSTNPLERKSTTTEQLGLSIKDKLGNNIRHLDVDSILEWKNVYSDGAKVCYFVNKANMLLSKPQAVSKAIL
jgi:hypothetical protein